MTKDIIVSPKYAENKEIMTLLERLPEVFSNNEGEIIYDKRNKICRITLSDGRHIILKKYKKPNFFQRICYSTLWNNKAKKAFLYGNRLLFLGIDTPEPIASVTYYNSIGMVEEYYFLSTEDTRPDCRILRDGNMDNPKPLIDALSQYLIFLHQQGFLHGDTNLSNFLYEKKADGTYHFAVIDTNRSRFLHSPASKKEALCNLVRITHDRCLLSAIVHSYATQRGWDAGQAVHYVLIQIEKRERRKRFIKRMRGK